MEIRPVRPHEHERLADITVAAYRAVDPDDPVWTRDVDGYESELRDVAGRAAGADVLVAVDGDGTVLGGVTYVGDAASPSAEFDDPEAAGIRMLAVALDAQGRGVGEALTRACIDRAVAAGRRRILLHSTEGMATAHRLYGRLGFARDPDLDWEPEPGFWLRGFRLVLDDERAPAR